MDIFSKSLKNFLKTKDNILINKTISSGNKSTKKFLKLDLKSLKKIN